MADDVVEVVVKRLTGKNKGSNHTVEYDVFRVFVVELVHDTATRHNLRQERFVGYASEKNELILILEPISQSEVEAIRSAVQRTLGEPKLREIKWRVSDTEDELRFKKSVC
jgi:hypothetical protein